MHRYELSSKSSSKTPSSAYPPKPTLSTNPSSSSASAPLIRSNSDSASGLDDPDVVFDGDEELLEDRRSGKGKGKEMDNGGGGQVVPYAHRDIKPG